MIQDHLQQKSSVSIGGPKRPTRKSSYCFRK